MVEHASTVSDAPTIRAYLAPAQHWALPLRDDFIQDPQAPLDHGLAEQAADERVAVRFILEPARDRAVHEALAIARGLYAGQRPSERQLGRMPRWATIGAGLGIRAYEPRPPDPRAAVEALVAARFRDLEVQTPTRDGDTAADPPTGSRETYGRADLPLRGDADTLTNGQESSA